MSDKLIRALVKPLVWQLVAYAEGPRYAAFDALYGYEVEAPDEATCDAIDATRLARIAAALEVDKVAALVEAEPVFIVEFEHLTAKDEEFPDEPMTTGATVIGRANFEALLKVMRNAGWRATDIMEREVTVPSEFAALAALGDREVG